MTKEKKNWKDGDVFKFKRPVELVSENRMISEVELREPTVKDFNKIISEVDPAKQSMKLLNAVTQLSDVDIEKMKISEYKPLLDSCMSFLVDTEE